MSDKKMIALLIGAVAVLLFITSLFFTKTTSTNDIYLIPAGFEGDIQVNYNVQGAPALEKEGNMISYQFESMGHTIPQSLKWNTG